MNRKLIYLLIASASLLPVSTHAQHENIWAFGTRAGLDFNSGSPVPVSTALHQVEGSASICDAQGQLLFYSEGKRTWDRQHNLMPNGNNIVASTDSVISSTQAALIVPFPGNTHQYYLFSISLTPSTATYNTVKLHYSIVDMTLNNGLGDIVPGKKGIILDDSYTLTEKLTAIPGTNCNVWVIVCRIKTNTYLAYEVNANGLNLTPVVSNTGGDLAQGGYLCGSPNHRKLVAANDRMNHDQPAGLILSDFDPATGIVSNSIQLDTYEEFYGAGFSPDNSKLYATIPLDFIYKSRLWQFDLNAPNPASAKTLLETGEANFVSGVKLAPDQKVYVIRNSAMMGIVNQPNEPGTACQYVLNGIRAVEPAAYAQGASLRMGVTNVVPVLPRDTLSHVTTDTTCGTARLQLTATDTTGWDYTWNDGSTGKQRIVTSSGTYRVTYHSPCRYHQDSFQVYIKAPASYSFSDHYCSNGTYSFNGRVLNQPGIYRDTVIAANGCDSVVILNLDTLTAPDVQIIRSRNEMPCIGDTILLTGSGADRYHWLHAGGQGQAEDSNYLYVLSQSTNHIQLVGFSGNNCTDTAETEIHAQTCCSLFIPDAFTPNNDARNDRFRILSNGRLSNYHMQIYNRWGQVVFTGYDLNDAWDGYFKSTPAEVGTYFYQISHTCPDGTEQHKKGDLLLIR